MARPFEIREDDLSGDEIRALIRLHLEGMHANSPPEHVCALGIDRLRSPEITVWSVWREDRLAGMGALKELGGKKGELKSMRTHPDFLRQGVAAALLEHIINVARARGMTRISLETGRGPAFDPAIALYRRYGFSLGGAFGDYEENAFSQFLYLELV
jgi:putative acetyltransferase